MRRQEVILPLPGMIENWFDRMTMVSSISGDAQLKRQSIRVYFMDHPVNLSRREALKSRAKAAVNLSPLEEDVGR